MRARGLIELLLKKIRKSGEKRGGPSLEKNSEKKRERVRRKKESDVREREREEKSKGVI